MGYCRHSAIYLALTLSTAAYKGVLEKGPINLFRYTAYNQQGHSWILYEPSADELYLLDATLRHGHNCFNLRNKDELIAAIEAYNAIDLNGILLDVLKQKNLYPVLGDENKHLLAIEAFNPAILEQFDTDEDFKRLQCLSGISSKLPCRPIRLLLKNMLTGEIVESTDIFDRDEIEAYESLQINDPFYPRKAALDPMGSMSEIIGRIEASDIKQTMLDLVVEKSIVAFPEKSAGPLLKEQSNQRKLQVAKKIAERAQQMAEKYINNKNDYSKKELDAIENGEAKTRDLPVKTSTIDGGVYSQCSHLMQFGAKKESEIINGVSPKPGYI